VNLISPFYSNLIKILQILVDLSSSFKTWSSSEHEILAWISDERSLQEIMSSVKKMENSPNFTQEMKSKFYETNQNKNKEKKR
jgi:hypothetical protein